MRKGGVIIEIGDVVRTLRDGCGKAVGERGNWKARGAVLWLVVGRHESSLYASDVCLHLLPLNATLTRKHPLYVDYGLCVLVSPRLRIT